MRRSVVVLLTGFLALVAACAPPTTPPPAWETNELAQYLPCVGSPTCVVTNLPSLPAAISDDGRIMLTNGLDAHSGLVLIGLEDRWIRQVLPPPARAVDVSGDRSLDLVAAVASGVTSFPDPDGSTHDELDKADELDLYLYDRSAQRLWRPDQPAGTVLLARASADGTRVVAIVADGSGHCGGSYPPPSIVAFDVAADTYDVVGTGFSADVSGDGTVVAWGTDSYRSRYGGDIVVHDLTTGDEVALGETKATAPRLSADGSRVAYWIDTQSQDALYTRGTAVAVRDLAAPSPTVVLTGNYPQFASYDGLPQCDARTLRLEISDDGARVIALRDVPGLPFDTLGPQELVDVSASGGQVGQINVGLLTMMMNAVSHNGNHVLSWGYPPGLLTHWKRTS